MIRGVGMDTLFTGQEGLKTSCGNPFRITSVVICQNIRAAVGGVVVC